MRRGFSVLEAVLAIAIMGMIIVLIIGMYTRLAASSDKMKYLATAQMIGYVVLNRLEEGFMGLDTSPNDTDWIKQIIEKLQDNDEVHCALKVSVTPIESAQYTFNYNGVTYTVTTASGEAERENAGTYFLALNLRKIADLGSGYTVEGVANVYWAWGNIEDITDSLLGETNLSSLGGLDLQDISILSSNSIVFNPTSIPFSQYKEKGFFVRGPTPQKVFIQVKRIFYISIL